MQINIDLDGLNKKGLSVNEYLTLLSVYYKVRNIIISYTDKKADYFSLKEKEYLTISGSSVTLTPKAIVLIEGVGRNYPQLATSIRDLFPRGLKGDKYPWRGTIKTVIDKLKKLDKSFGLADHSDEQILDVISKYVNKFSFSDMDRGMQIAPYFIEKDGSSSLMAWLSMDEVVNEIKSMDIKL